MMKDRIKENINDPEKLEQLYRVKLYYDKRQNKREH